MKTLIFAIAIGLLAGCSSMGTDMPHDSSGGMGMSAPGASGPGSGDDYYSRDDGFHSWRN